MKPATLADYGRRIGMLSQYCLTAGLTMGSRALDEVAILEWADHSFAEGLSAQEGTKMLAAYTHFHPENGRFGQPLARVARALQAWGRIVPSLGRIPPAFPMVCGIVSALKSQGHADMALAALVALSGYLRPGELHDLRGRDAVAPMPQFGEGYQFGSLVLGARDVGPTKTNIYDDAVILNHPSLQWVSGLLERQVASHPGMAPLWDFDDMEFKVAFVRAAELSGLGHLGLTPYHLRHAGPSWDALTGLRGQREIQRRGRWASQTSVVRYERASQVVGALQRLPDVTLVYLHACKMHLAEIMLDQALPPVCPGM